MTKSVILTPAHIERLKSGALADREVPGLSVIVAGPAKKQWRFKRVVAGTKKTIELILGTYPAFSIDEAREWAGPLSKAAVRGEDLKPFVRRIMTQMEEDLGTTLDWVAVDHFNTGHPHSHIMLRGKDDRGENLVIAREYIAQGLRARASEIATLDLGPKTQLEIETRMRRDIEAERLTDTDRQLLREGERRPLVKAKDRDPVVQSLRAGRLQKLGAMGLADEIAPGQWRLAKDMRETLTRMGERGDIIRTMQRELTARSRDVAPGDRAVHDGASPLTEPLVARVVMRDLSDELSDRHFLIVDGVDGRSHFVEIGAGDGV